MWSPTTHDTMYMQKNKDYFRYKVNTFTWTWWYVQGTYNVCSFHQACYSHRSHKAGSQIAEWHWGSRQFLKWNTRCPLKIIDNKKQIWIFQTINRQISKQFHNIAYSTTVEAHKPRRNYEVNTIWVNQWHQAGLLLHFWNFSGGI